MSVVSAHRVGVLGAESGVIVCVVDTVVCRREGVSSATYTGLLNLKVPDLMKSASRCANHTAPQRPVGAPGRRQCGDLRATRYRRAALCVL